MPSCIGTVNPSAAEDPLCLVKAALFDRENPGLGSWDLSLALGMLAHRCRWVGLLRFLWRGKDEAGAAQRRGKKSHFMIKC